MTSEIAKSADERLVGDLAHAVGVDGPPAEVTDAAKALVPATPSWRYGDVVVQDGRLYTRILDDNACGGPDPMIVAWPWESPDSEYSQYMEDAVDPARAVLIARDGKTVIPLPAAGECVLRTSAPQRPTVPRHDVITAMADFVTEHGGGPGLLKGLFKTAEEVLGRYDATLDDLHVYYDEGISSGVAECERRTARREATLAAQAETIVELRSVHAELVEFAERLGSPPEPHSRDDMLAWVDDRAGELREILRPMGGGDRG